jgi:hypothetical protein
MKIDKFTIISTIIVFSLLVFIFLIFQVFLATTGIYSSDQMILQITPVNPETIANLQAQPTQSEDETILPGVFSAGLEVMVTNTGGDGLRVRIESGLDSTPLFLATEGELFNIIGGPSLIDNHVWWEIESTVDKSRTGWAVQDYLQVVDP